MPSKTLAGSAPGGSSGSVLSGGRGQAAHPCHFGACSHPVAPFSFLWDDLRLPPCAGGWGLPAPCVLPSRPSMTACCPHRSRHPSRKEGGKGSVCGDSEPVIPRWAPSARVDTGLAFLAVGGGGARRAPGAFRLEPGRARSASQQEGRWAWGARGRPRMCSSEERRCPKARWGGVGPGEPVGRCCWGGGGQAA